MSSYSYLSLNFEAAASHSTVQILLTPLLPIVRNYQPLLFIVCVWSMEYVAYDCFVRIQVSLILYHFWFKSS